MNTLAKMLSKIPGFEEAFKKKPQRIGHEPTPMKKVRGKVVKTTNKRKKLIERKEKNHRKMEAHSRKINRLRGVGIQ